MMSKAKVLWCFFFGWVLAVLFDQWTKWLAIIKLKDGPAYEVIPGIFEFYYSENRGAAFGILQGKFGFFFLVAVGVIIFVAYVLYKMPVNRRFLPLSVACVLISAGAAGNLVDRMAYGFVVDFLYFRLINFPIFNVADCFVSVGTGILFFLVMFYYREEELEAVFKRKGGKG